ncbi:MAG: DUF4239 domain-containing protein [Acetobacteraceae bacterium]|nr:DUF4239 domain-containing protein [Acetobacteraceae bacterium]
MMFFTTRPLWLSAVLLVGLMTLVAMAGPVLVRRRVSLDRLRINNEVAGFKFAVVGVIYAVLLAFAVIVVWERFDNAESAVAQEAGAAATLYRLADGLGAEPSTTLRSSLTGYLRAVITEDWPAMERGGASRAVTHALGGLYTAVLIDRPSDGRGTAVLTAILQQIDLMTQARRARLVMASGIVPGIVWLVLLGGAVVTIGFTLFFGTENLRAQALMTGALSIMIFSSLLIIVAIDHPFAGSVKVQPEAFAAVLEDFSAASRP